MRGSRSPPICTAAPRLGTADVGWSRTRSSTPPPVITRWWPRSSPSTPSSCFKADVSACLCHGSGGFRGSLWSSTRRWRPSARWAPGSWGVLRPSSNNCSQPAEQARREQPASWAPLYEAVVQVTRVAFIDSDVGAAVEHARHAVTAAQADPEQTFTVATVASLAHALFFAGDRAQARTVALDAAERPEAPERPGGYVAALGLLAAIDAEQGHSTSAMGWARQAIGYAQETGQADLWPVALAHLGLATALVATGDQAEAEREASRGERLRRTPHPTAAHAHALLVLANVRAARSRSSRAATDLARARATIADLPDPGRLAAIAAQIQTRLDARAPPDRQAPIEPPSDGELAVLHHLASDLSQREIAARLYISLNTVKTHTRELYRKLDVHSRADAVARAATLGLLDAGKSPG